MTDFSLEFVFASGERHSPKVEPSEWLLRSDADTVADSLTVRFSAGKRLFTEEPVGAVLKKDGAVLFDGIVDEHRVKCQNGARTEVFSLRSRAALLLDNEAAPMELRLPSLRLLERMYLMPLGLHAVGGDRRPVEGVLTVEKGVSCFEALQTFSERYLNCTPYTDKSGGVHFESYVPKTVKPDWVTAREVIFCPYKMLSGVTVQNALMQRAYNRICLKRGAFCYDRVLGSRFYMLDAADEHTEERALRYAQAALLPLAGVEAVSVRREGERFIFGLQTMLGTGEIAVKGAKV